MLSLSALVVIRKHFLIVMNLFIDTALTAVQRWKSDKNYVKQNESGDILLPLFLYIMHVVVHYIYRKHFAWALYRM